MTKADREITLEEWFLSLPKKERRALIKLAQREIERIEGYSNRFYNGRVYKIRETVRLAYQQRKPEYPTLVENKSSSGR